MTTVFLSIIMKAEYGDTEPIDDFIRAVASRNHSRNAGLRTTWCRCLVIVPRFPSNLVYLRQVIETLLTWHAYQRLPDFKGRIARDVTLGLCSLSMAVFHWKSTA